jgi:hypothetical protein
MDEMRDARAGHARHAFTIELVIWHRPSPAAAAAVNRALAALANEAGEIATGLAMRPLGAALGEGLKPADVVSEYSASFRVEDAAPDAAEAKLAEMAAMNEGAEDRAEAQRLRAAGRLS